ncbi:MAG: hypothetical protein JO188_18635 [Hyphomicrobiales bacterium]|nr:hypothetical protein [Hyphomicrobiales bacterium]
MTLPALTSRLYRRPAPRLGSRAPSATLLASTSLAALLLGMHLPAKAGGISVNNNVPNVSSVSNPANTTVTSIIVNASSLSGAISNAGTITPNFVGGMERAAITVTNSTIGQGIVNSGTIGTNANSAIGDGIFVSVSTISSGGIANTIGITVTSTGIFIGQSTVAGGTQAAITNSGTITATSAASSADGILVSNSTITGDIVNNSTISATGRDAVGVGVNSSTVTGSVTNAGSISATAQQKSNVGIFITGSTVTGSVTNSGTITVTSSKSFLNTGIIVAGSSVTGGVVNLGTINSRGATRAGGIHVSSTFGAPSSIGGGIANSGTIAATAPNGNAAGITVGFTPGGNAVADQVAGGITNSGTILVSGNTAVGIQSSTAAIITGGISNSGTIIANGANGKAIGILAGDSASNSGLTNNGTIIASGATGGTGILVQAVFSGGANITNIGTIFGSSNAISASNQINTTIDQVSGALIGGVTFAPIFTLVSKRNMHSVIVTDQPENILNVTGGALSLQPTSKAAGIGIGGLSVNQSGGNIVLQVTPSAAAGQFPTVSVNNLTLSGVLEVAPQSGTFAAGQTITYPNVFTAGTLSNGVTSVQVFDFFSTGATASLVQGANANQLSVTLTNNSGMALTPGVASGAGTFTTLTNPLGAILPAVSVTNGASVNGGIVNAGFIGAPGNPGSTGILVSGGQLSQPIVNTGTIAGTVAAIDVSGASAATTITQSSGAIQGAIKLSANADVLTINGGTIAGDIIGEGTSDTVIIAPVGNPNDTFIYGNTISGISTINLGAGANLALTAQGVINNAGVLNLTSTSRITGLGSLTQSGTTALQFMNNTTAGNYPTINAMTIALSGKLQVVLAGPFPSAGMQDFVKVFAASGTLTNSIAPGNVSVVTMARRFPPGRMSRRNSCKAAIARMS